MGVNLIRTCGKWCDKIKFSCGSPFFRRDMRLPARRVHLAFHRPSTNRAPELKQRPVSSHQDQTPISRSYRERAGFEPSSLYGTSAPLGWILQNHLSNSPLSLQGSVGSQILGLRESIRGQPWGSAMTQKERRVSSKFNHPTNLSYTVRFLPNPIIPWLHPLGEKISPVPFPPIQNFPREETGFSS